MHTVLTDKKFTSGNDHTHKKKYMNVVKKTVSSFWLVQSLQNDY